jgi:hypothetical protein
LPGGAIGDGALDDRVVLILRGRATLRARGVYGGKKENRQHGRRDEFQHARVSEKKLLESRSDYFLVTSGSAASGSGHAINNRHLPLVWEDPEAFSIPVVVPVDGSIFQSALDPCGWRLRGRATLCVPDVRLRNVGRGKNENRQHGKRNEFQHACVSPIRRAPHFPATMVPQLKGEGNPSNPVRAGSGCVPSHCRAAVGVVACLP